MDCPITLNFDRNPETNYLDGALHLLKVYQGAPYDQIFSIQNVDGSYVRDFSGYGEIRMQARLTQGDSTVLFELTQTLGYLVGTDTGLQIVFPASLTKDLVLTYPDTAQVNEVLFVHDIELITGGVVVERLAQGTGWLVVSTTRG